MTALWAFIMSFVAAASIFIPVVVVVYTLRLRNLHDPKACSACGYPKEGSDSMTCPECGHPWHEHSHRRTTAKEEMMVLAALIGVPFMVFVVLMVLLVFAV